VIAVDSSSFIAYLSGDRGEDVDALESNLRGRSVILPPAVVCELLSDPKPAATLAGTLDELPILSVMDGYWRRAGLLRAALHTRGLKAGLADALIAQSCLDHDVPLITRDRDFRHFARHGGLRLLP
jgi:hypothetical protein